MSDAVKEISQAEFKDTVASGTVLVDFWSPYCGPCLALAPVLDEVAGKVAGKASIVKVNVTENPDLAGEFGVQGIPLLVLLKDGNEAGRLLGARPGEEIVSFIENAG